MKKYIEKTVQETIENNYIYIHSDYEAGFNKYSSINLSSNDIKCEIYKKINEYITEIFLYKNDHCQYVKTLKKILILLIENKKHKNLVKLCYDIVDIYIDNFTINDIEYNNLVKYYKQ
jgi:uncharacterized protein (UPF0128 family)